MLDTGSGVHEWRRPGLWAPSASTFVLQQSRALCASGPAGALGRGQSTWHHCTGGGPMGRSRGSCCRPQPAAVILGLS